MTGVEHGLEVSRYEFMQALGLIRKLLAKRDLPEAVISFDGDEVTIALAGVSFGAPAKGTWPGCVIAPGSFFALLARGLPANRAGLRKPVAEAKEQAAQLIAKAAKVLVPLNIDRRDLQSLLDRRLRGEQP